MHNNHFHVFVLVVGPVRIHTVFVCIWYISVSVTTTKTAACSCKGLCPVASPFMDLGADTLHSANIPATFDTQLATANMQPKWHCRALVANTRADTDTGAKQRAELGLVREYSSPLELGLVTLTLPSVKDGPGKSCSVTNTGLRICRTCTD